MKSKSFENVYRLLILAISSVSDSKVDLKFTTSIERLFALLLHSW